MRRLLCCVACVVCVAFAWCIGGARGDGGTPPEVSAWDRTGPSFWIERQLELIRRDIPFPTVQSRNLFHVSAAMHDAWAAFDPEVDGLLVRVDAGLPSDDRLARIALGTAASEVLRHRYALTNRDGLAMMTFEQRLRALGLREELHGDEARAAAVGREVAHRIIAEHADDGSNEHGRYLNASGYRSANTPLDPWRSGASLSDPDRWQPIMVNGRTQRPVTPHWVDVRPFALPEREAGRPYLDPGPPPRLNAEDHAVLAASMVELILMSSRMDGFSEDPEADYGRVVAEYWEDGPSTESPPGHWNLFALEVAARVGEGMDEVDRLAWEVGLFITLNAALHDASIACWNIKYHYDSVRPISLIRHMGGLGQSSDAALPSYHPMGLPLVPGLIELVDEASSAPGQRHEAMTPGDLAIYCWRGNPDHRNTQVSGVGWMPAVSWLPYQDAGFITPAFPGYPSGHSTYSTAASEVLAWYTGSDEIPGGPLRFAANSLVFLDFERGPSREVVLEWSRFSEAAREAGRSRLWGGIHPWFDDVAGQRVGREVARLVRLRWPSTYLNDSDATAP